VPAVVEEASLTYVDSILNELTRGSG
jgi:hypothetical protein